MTLVRATGLAIAGRLEPTDLQLAAGEIVGVIGRNGAGKTSLLHALAGIGFGVQGVVEVAGERLDQVGPARRPFLLGYLPAARELAWPLRVADLVALGLGAGADARVAEALARFDLQRLAARRADRLSTGERTRAMLARAFAPRAPLLLLDEPMANLDPDWRLRLAELLRDEAGRGAAVVVTLHDLLTAERAVDRLLVVAEGRIIADGAPPEILARAAVQNSFGLRRTPDGWARA